MCLARARSAFRFASADRRYRCKPESAFNVRFARKSKTAEALRELPRYELLIPVHAARSSNTRTGNKKGSESDEAVRTGH
jgi:hypothetical protein